MIKKLAEKVSRVFADAAEQEPGAAARENAIRSATAVLMTEVARADYEYDETEFDALLGLITQHFHMDPEDAAELANKAGETAEDYVSLHSFTQQLNNSLNDIDKERVVSLLWQIAYADGRLDKYEDSLVSRISELLHVSRSRVMKLKHDANPAAINL